MTTVDRVAVPRGRTLNVVRLQFVNMQTFVWVPALVLGGAWIVTLLIYWLIRAAGAEGAVLVGGGAQAPLWYFAVVGGQAMTMSFPFSQAMSLTRREFYLGSLLAASLSALGMSIVFVLLGLLEKATDGYGIDGWFAHLDWLWVHGPLAAGFTYFTVTMLWFVIGFWFATVYKRWGTLVVVAAIVGIVLVLLGGVALITLNQAWGDVWMWILDAGALGLTFCALALAAVLTVGSYLSLRRMPA